MCVCVCERVCVFVSVCVSVVQLVNSLLLERVLKVKETFHPSIVGHVRANCRQSDIQLCKLQAVRFSIVQTAGSPIFNCENCRQSDFQLCKL